MCDDRDGSGDVVQGGVGDMTDAGTGRPGADASADDHQGGATGVVDENLRGTAAPARLDHLDVRELLLPGTHHLAQESGLSAFEGVVEFGVAA